MMPFVELLLGPKPVEDRALMSTQHLGDVFHRFDLASHRTEIPAMEKLLCLGGVGIVPEALEVLLQQISFDGAQVHLQ